MSENQIVSKIIKERVELHCHSKSGGDATMYAGELIKHASIIGLSGVAITDRASILSYPEIERTWNSGNYTAKPIFGMEMLVEGDVAGKTYGISVLVKNELGKQNLYRLIYDSDNTDDFPVYKESDLLKFRDGLLLGSGVENGKIYRYANQDVTDKEMLSVMDGYDYIEVIPGKEYEDFNIRIIGLCESIRKPVVAVSDAHYLEKKDRTAWKIIKNWENDRTGSDIHLMSTKEMLAAFDYIPEDKAWEIVVENTNIIASECGILSIVLTENMYPRMDNAYERLLALCYSALEEKYDENMISKAKERLESELESIEKTGIVAALYEKIIWKYDLLLKWPVLYKEYKGTIKSDHDGNARDISVRVKQSLFSVYVFLKTDESYSKAITSYIVNRDGEYVLCYSYLNHPKAEVRERSEIHYGTSILRIEEKAKQLEGTYFTDRNTKGDIILHGIEMKKQKGQI